MKRLKGKKFIHKLESTLKSTADAFTIISILSAAGAAFGSAFPGPGTAAGAAVGAAVGGIIVGSIAIHHHIKEHKLKLEILKENFSDATEDKSSAEHSNSKYSTDTSGMVEHSRSLHGHTPSPFATTRTTGKEHISKRTSTISATKMDSSDSIVASSKTDKRDEHSSDGAATTASVSMTSI